jgi:hypothetical protein
MTSGRIKITVLIVAAGMLSGCATFKEFYGVDSFGQFVSDQGCIRQYGISCTEMKRQDDEWQKQRDALRSAAWEVDYRRRVINKTAEK